MFDGGISTVKSAKKFLDEELKKYNSWEELPECLINLLNTDIPKQKTINFKNLKQKGVGQTTIMKFLGDGWKQWQI